MSNSKEKEEELKELVIARLSTLPADKEVSIGSSGQYTRDQLIESVRKGNTIGRKVIEVELNYLQSLKNLTSDLLADE